MDDLISRQNLIMTLTVTAEETEQMKAGDLKKVINVINNQPSAQPSDAVEVVRCKDCIYFELDHWVNVNGQPLIVAHEICAAWGGGCKTIPDGYCNMGERKEDGGICL